LAVERFGAKQCPACSQALRRAEKSMEKLPLRPTRGLKFCPTISARTSWLGDASGRTICYRWRITAKPRGDRDRL